MHSHPSYSLFGMAELYERSALCLQAPGAFNPEGLRTASCSHSAFYTYSASISCPAFAHSGHPIGHCAFSRNHLLPLRFQPGSSSSTSIRTSTSSAVCRATRTSTRPCDRFDVCLCPSAATAPTVRRIKPPLHMDLSEQLTSRSQRSLWVLPILSRIGHFPISVLRDDVWSAGCSGPSCVQRASLRRGTQRHRPTNVRSTAHSGASGCGGATDARAGKGRGTA